MPNSPMECGGQPEKLQPPPMGVAAAAAGGVCLRCSIKFHTGGHTGMWIRRAPQRRPCQRRKQSCGDQVLRNQRKHTHAAAGAGT